MPPKIDNPTDIRKAMLRNGWTPLANLSKQCKLPDWSKLVVDEAVIGRWSRSTKFKATGGRLDQALQIDNDSDHPIRDAHNDAWAAAYPDHFDNPDVPLLVRGTTASLKQSTFFRYVPTEGEPAMRVIRTRRFLAPDGTDHHVAFYTGAGRQAGMFGPHNVADNGEVLSIYTWEFEGEDPTTVKLADLPGLTKEDCYKLAEIAEQVYLDNGFTPAPLSTGGETGGEHHYDIADDARFDCDDMVTRGIAEMIDALEGGAELRCSASCIDGTPHGNRSRCHARVQGGVLVIHDYDSADDHSPKADDFSASLAGLGSALDGIENLGGLKELMQGNPATNPAEARALKLLKDMVYCMSGDNPQAHWKTATTMKAGVGMKRLGENEAQHRYTFTPAPGPRGGQPKPITLYPEKLWLSHPKRVNVDAGAMRPDMIVPKPGALPPYEVVRTFEEDGLRYLNLYQPPLHTATGGSSAAIWELIEQNMPDPVERDYSVKWLAHKYRNPGIPGTGLVSIAPDRYGTGRGALKKLIEKMFGERYVATVAFAELGKKSYQGQYNEYLIDCLFVCVDETTQVAGSSHYKERHDTYAVLREDIEIAASTKHIKLKGVGNRQVKTYASYFIASNADLPFELPENDRRLHVWESGQVRPEGDPFWKRIHAALDDPACVAAFLRDLMLIDLSSFDIFAMPPLTSTKKRIAEASKSPLDRAIDEALDWLRKRSPLFTAYHVIQLVNLINTHDKEEGAELPDRWANLVGYRIRAKAISTGLRVRLGSGSFAGRYMVFVWDEAGHMRFGKADEAFLKASMEGGGKLGPTFASEYAADREAKLAR